MNRALSANLKRGMSFLDGASPSQIERGEAARDAILTRVEAYLAALRAADPYAASAAEQKAKRLRVGYEKHWAPWWMSRVATPVEMLLEGL